MTIKTTLLPHQQPAVDKLLRISIGALYMEMGTGKTRTALEIVQRRHEAGRLDAVLWLCPCSVKANLAADLDKHADGWRDIISIYGIESLSSSARLALELLSRVSSGQRYMLIVDESNLVKNPDAIRSQRVTLIASHCKYRMILNGTPISKNEADLFAQWYLLDWRVLGYLSYHAFAANHLEIDPDTHRVKRALNVDYLVKKLSPYSYQVKRTDCFELPPKRYYERTWYMTCEQEQEYDDAYYQLMLQLDELKPATIYRMFAGMQAVISGLSLDFSDPKHFKTKQMFSALYDNPHICALSRMLREDIADEKAIIFCKYTHEITSVSEMIAKEYGEGSAVTMYGSDSLEKRRKNIALFTKSARFLVANKACAGYGLNLQFCRNVIYYSNDWDYATRIQSEDRVHRLGQERDVHIYDMVCADSLDVRILSCLNRKELLLDNIKRELSSANDKKESLLRSFFFGKRKQKGGSDDAGKSLLDD